MSRYIHFGKYSIQILHEFSLTEFTGIVFENTDGQWKPLTSQQIKEMKAVEIDSLTYDVIWRRKEWIDMQLMCVCAFRLSR